MTLTKFSPRHTTPFNSFLEDFFGRDSQELSNSRSFNTPAVNIKESETGFDVEVAAPGLNKNDFNVELKHNKLHVSAKQETETATEDTKERYYRKEFSYQNFSRSFTLPHTVDREGISANYENGVLTLSIPKKKEVIENAHRQIKIA